MNISIIDALDEAAKEALLLNAIHALRSGAIAPGLKIFNSNTFRRIEDVPIAHQAPRAMLSQAAKGQTLSSKGIVAHQGNGAAVQYHRLRWEVPFEGIKAGTWMNMAHGTSPQPFFKNTTHVFLWENNGAECKANVCFRYPYLNGNYGFKIQAEEFYGKPGLAYGKRTSEFTCQILPAGHIFSFEGTAIHSESCDQALWATLAVLNSRTVQFWLNSVCAEHKAYNYLNQVPISDQILKDERLAEMAKQGVRLRMEIVRWAVTSPYFVVPNSLTDGHASTNSANLDALNRLRAEIDRICRDHYGISGDLCPWTNKQREGDNDDVEAEDIESEEEHDEPEHDHSSLSFGDTLDYLVGTPFGRWDIRYATGERQPPELPDPFDPLPVCAPGMLQNAEGLPAEPKDVPTDYPLRISWSGILVDDENHPEDIVARVREAIEVIWKDRAETIEQEACGILGVKTLRDYFRRPAAFFADHLERYSKSRRKAPICWPLSTKSGSYILWLYYHRLTDQTLHTCLADFLDPKIRKVNAQLDAVTASGGSSARAGDLREFLDELHELREEIERIIKLPWRPNLNDGVLITASPLHKLFRLPKWQKDLKACWEKLQNGDYDWAHLSYTIWPQRVEKACERDRSIAIAHGLEHLCKAKPPKPTQKRGKKGAQEESGEDELILIKEN
jgi:hypothetical protein